MRTLILLIALGLGIPASTHPRVSSFKEEEISFKNGDIELSGTLTLPVTSGQHPALVMITGSGPQNRDEEVAGFKSFKIIAEYLSEHGIAVLRCDDRGVGHSKGPSVFESTDQDFATDVIAGIKYLETRNDIYPKQIGLFGHSEGGTVAPLVYTKYTGIAFMIIMAGPAGVSGADALLEQQFAIGKAAGSSDTEITAGIKYYKGLFDVLKKTKDTASLTAYIRNGAMERFNLLPPEEKEKTDTAVFIKTILQRDMHLFNTTWFRALIEFNAKPYLEKVTCPVLMLWGGKDLQVSRRQNEQQMLGALKKAGNKNVTSKLFENANHLFLNAVTGSPSEYKTLPKEFVTGFLPFISEWLHKNKIII